MSALRARTARGRRKSHSAWRRVRSKGPRDTLQLCLTMHRRGQHPSQAVRYRRGRRGLAPLRVLQHAAAAVAPLDGDGLGMPQRRVLPPTRASTAPVRRGPVVGQSTNLRHGSRTVVYTPLPHPPGGPHGPRSSANHPWYARRGESSADKPRRTALAFRPLSRGARRADVAQTFRRNSLGKSRSTAVRCAALGGPPWFRICTSVLREGAFPSYLYPALGSNPYSKCRDVSRGPRR